MALAREFAAEPMIVNNLNNGASISLHYRIICLDYVLICACALQRRS